MAVTMPVGAGGATELTTCEVRGVACSPDGSRVAVATQQGAWTWALTDGQWRRGSTLGPRSGGRHLTRLAVSRDGHQVAGGRGDGAVYVWRADTGGELRRVAHRAWVTGVAFDPRGQRFASAGVDGCARIWDVDSGQRLLEMEHGGRVDAVAFSPDGRYLATAGAHRRARVWDTETADQVLELAHPSTVRDVAFGPDGRSLATAARDGNARVWDARSGEQTLVVRHGWSVWGRSVERVAFSPDGRRLATAGRDRTARLWDLATGEQLLEIGHARPVDGVAFGPDARSVLTAGDGLRIWDVPAGGGEDVHLGVRSPTSAWLADAVGRLGQTLFGLGIVVVGVILAVVMAWLLFVEFFGAWIVDDVVRDPDGTIIEAGVLDLGREGEVRVGDCLVEDVPRFTRWIVAWLEEWWGDPIVGVPCEEPHDLEVFAATALPDDLGAAAPDEAVIDVEAEMLCDARFAEFVGRGIATSELSYVFWSPSPSMWQDGHRGVECWLTSSDGSELEGSMRNSGR
jgi:WD40 repeat protein